MLVTSFGYKFRHIWSYMVILLIWEKTAKMFITDFWVWLFMSHIWEVLRKNHERGIWEVWNFMCWAISLCREKNQIITVFLRGPQISAKYLFKLSRQKIFAVSVRSYIQLVLKISFTMWISHPSCNLLELKLILLYILFLLCSTSPQVYIKSETGQRTISKYLVWNNWN